jgi:hypothetical protein
VSAGRPNDDEGRGGRVASCGVAIAGTPLD